VLANEGRLEPRRALELLGQVAEALDAAHEHELVHRDVKPGNILIARQAGREHVYLSDFGLTKQASSDSGLTETGQFVGTADYVAPEQIRRQPVGPRTDVYSLGCVVFECLAGEPPYPSTSLLASIYAHLEQAPPTMSGRDAGLPPGIDAVIARALAKSPADRYSTCRELVDAARSELGISGEMQAFPAGGRLTRRQVVLAGGGALALAAAAAVPAVLLTRGGRREAVPPLVIEPGSLVRIDPAMNKPVAAVQGGHVSAIAVGEGAVWSANRIDGTVSRIDPQALAVTKTVSVRGSPIDLTAGEGAVWVVSSLEGDGKLSEIETSTGRVRRVHSLGYSDPAAVAAGHGAVWVTANDLARGSAVLRVDPGTGEVVAAIPLPTRLGPIAVGEGSVWAHIGTVGGEGLWRIDPSTNGVAATIQVRVEGDPGAIAVGEGSVWVAGPSGSVSRIDPATNRVTRTTKLVPVWVLDIAAGEGSLWVTNGGSTQLLRVDPTTASVVATIDLPPRQGGVTGGFLAVGAEGVWIGISG
jgi:hypothetical protein